MEKEQDQTYQVINGRKFANELFQTKRGSGNAEPD